MADRILFLEHLHVTLFRKDCIFVQLPSRVYTSPLFLLNIGYSYPAILKSLNAVTGSLEKQQASVTHRSKSTDELLWYISTRKRLLTQIPVISGELSAPGTVSFFLRVNKYAAPLPLVLAILGIMQSLASDWVI